MTSPFINDTSTPDVQPRVIANVKVGNIESDDNAAKFKPPSDPLGIWTDYIIDNKYENDPHTYMLPIASPNGFQNNKAAFCRLASSTLLWICDWTGARWNIPPEAPSPVPSDANWVILNKSAETRNVTVGPDGQTPLYRISGTYVYGHKNPPDDLFDSIQFGRPPWLDNTIMRTYPKSSIEKGLSDIVGGGGGGLPINGPIVIK